jgi:periplasmic protein TonB
MYFALHVERFTGKRTGDNRNFSSDPGVYPSGKANMFDQTFVNAQARTRRPWTVGVSLGLQTGAVVVLMIAPLLRIPPLEMPAKTPVWLPLQNMAPVRDAKPEARPQARTATFTRPVFSVNRIFDPAAAPPRIEWTPDVPDIAGSAAAGPVAPTFAGLLPGTGFHPAPPVSPVKPPAPVAPAQIRVGGDVQAAKLIFGPRPAYPPIAVTTRTEGTVRIQAVIARDGTIRNLQVTSGPPLLVNAAIGAVRQWRYRPTLLNDQPVEVVTEIDVNFTLSR